MTTNAASQPLSIVHGIPLSEEPGLGTLTIPGYLREVCSRYAEREALVMHTVGGAERWSYSALWERSVEVAKALIACGVGKDSRVGILMTNRPEYLSALFGTALAGGVAVALSTFSTAVELEYLITASGVSVLLFDGRVPKKDFGAVLVELEPQLSAAAIGPLQSARFPFLRHLVRLDPVVENSEGSVTPSARFEPWRNFLARGRDIPEVVVGARAALVAPSDTAGLFFSSGTTNLPKGILHTQRAFAIQWWRYPHLMNVDGAIRSWTGNGFFWSGNVTMTVGLALSTGGAIVLQPYFEAEAALKLFEAERVDFLSGRPHQWARLQEAPNWATTDLSRLRYITRAELLRTHPTVATDWEVPMAYGNTETLSINTSNIFNIPPGQPTGSFGAPCPGNILKIVDPETGEVMPRGKRGEVCIKGPTLTLGYVGKSIEETFDEEGYFRTGDGGYVDTEGRLFWEGRLTEIIKTGGANVSPLEIDAALALYPGVRRAQTVGIPHETLGEMVVSCIVPHDNVTLDPRNIAAFLKERLASYKLPKEILFFKDEDIAVTGSGKVKLAQLRPIVTARLEAREQRAF
jgi:fatty-acyl-CoA synthase